MADIWLCLAQLACILLYTQEMLDVELTCSASAELEVKVDEVPDWNPNPTVYSPGRSGPMSVVSTNPNTEIQKIMTQHEIWDNVAMYMYCDWWM